MMSPRREAPLSTMTEIVPDQLWSVPHRIAMLSGVVLPARMVVIRLASDALALHSPVPLTDDLAAAIAAHGRVTTLIAPNNMHHLYLRPAMERYPDAEVWAAPGLPAKRKNLSLPNLLGPGCAPPFADVLAPYFLAGAPAADETCFVHRPTRSLICTDSLFNLGDVDGWLSPVLFRLTGAWRRPAQTRIWRAVVKDRAAMGASTRALLAQDFDRVIPAHGDVIEAGGREVYARCAGWLGV
jgi:hypothetical protein